MILNSDLSNPQWRFLHQQIQGLTKQRLLDLPYTEKFHIMHDDFILNTKLNVTIRNYWTLLVIEWQAAQVQKGNKRCHVKNT